MFYDFIILLHNFPTPFTPDNQKSFSIVCFSFFCLNLISECAHQTFTFDGRCYTTCPERTFIVPEKIAAGEVDSKGLSLRRRAANIEEFDNLQDIIGRTESLVKNRAIFLASSQKLCGSCHESCTSCNGPLDSDCVICDSDYNQIIIGSQISCSRRVNNATGSLLSGIKSKLSGYSKPQIVLICSLMVASLAITSVAICLLCRKHDYQHATKTDRDKIFSGKYSYGPINQETEEILLSTLPDIPAEALDDDSDESEP